MDVLITLFYILFSICVVYPPTEFVSAGFTIPQLLDNFLGSENVNFIGYHIKRIAVTALIHSALPLGYVFALWCGGEKSEWLPASAIATAIIPVLLIYKIIGWFENDKKKHPVVKAILPYVDEGSDWRTMATYFNMGFRSIEKVAINLTATSKIIATRNFLIKVTQYGLNIVKQDDCALVATATDSHNLNPTGEDEIQYVNIEVIPTRPDVERFILRITTIALRQLQPCLLRPITVPDHISLLPSLIERFVMVFKQHVEKNPVYYVGQELEPCIGCMQATANVKLDRMCDLPTNVQDAPQVGPLFPLCQQCNCRVLWCVSCMARWWAARAGGPPVGWLSARGSCPVCRAPFCLLDVRPASASLGPS